MLGTARACASRNCVLQDIRRNDENKEEEINWTTVFIIVSTMFCDYFLGTVVIPIFPQHYQNDYNLLHIGLLLSMKPLFQLLFHYIINSEIVKNGPILSLLRGTISLSIAAFLMTLGILKNSSSLSYSIVLVSRAIHGIASASIVEAGMALMASSYEELDAVRVMSIAMTAIVIGGLLGPPLGGIISYHVNQWFSFLMVGALLLALTNLQVVYIFLPQRKRSNYGEDDSASIEKSLPTTSLLDHDSSDITSRDTFVTNDVQPFEFSVADTLSFMWKLLVRVDFLIIAFSAIVCYASIGMLEPLVPRWLENEYDQNILWQGIIFGCVMLAYLIGTPLAGVFSEMIPPWMCLMIGFSIMGAGLLIFSLSKSVEIVSLSLFLYGFGVGFADVPIALLVADIVKELSGSDEERLLLLSREEEALLTEIKKSRVWDGDDDDITLRSKCSSMRYDTKVTNENYEKSLLSAAYVMLNICYLLGFVVGPLVGTCLKLSYGMSRTYLFQGVLCFWMMLLVFISIGFRKLFTKKKVLELLRG